MKNIYRMELNTANFINNDIFYVLAIQLFFSLVQRN